MTALLAIAFVLMSPGLAGSASAAAVGDAPERATEELEITAVSPWVEAEGTFEVSELDLLPKPPKPGAA